MKKTFAVTVAMLLLPLATVAFGQTRKARRAHHPRTCETMFQRLDANGDQKISQDEFVNNDQVFDKLDKNHDGKVTADEVQPPPDVAGTRAAQPRRHPLMQADGDHDGVITAAEFKEFRAARFKEMDANADGFITKDECKRRPASPPKGTSEK